jgi:hypothetical protein
MERQSRKKGQKRHQKDFGHRALPARAFLQNAPRKFPVR